MGHIGQRIVSAQERERERGAKAMKLTLVNFIIATVIIITMVEAGPLKEVLQISPISDPIQNSGADRSSANPDCKPRWAICTEDSQCCSGRCESDEWQYIACKDFLDW